jgi:hypothetical protein
VDLRKKALFNEVLSKVAPSEEGGEEPVKKKNTRSKKE